MLFQDRFLQFRPGIGNTDIKDDVPIKTVAIATWFKKKTSVHSSLNKRSKFNYHCKATWLYHNWIIYSFFMLNKYARRQLKYNFLTSFGEIRSTELSIWHYMMKTGKLGSSLGGSSPLNENKSILFC